MPNRTTERDHPRHYHCKTCGAKPGEWCKSKTGRTIIKYEKQHADRFNQSGALRFVY